MMNLIVGDIGFFALGLAIGLAMGALLSMDTRDPNTFIPKAKAFKDAIAPYADGSWVPLPVVSMDWVGSGKFITVPQLVITYSWYDEAIWLRVWESGKIVLQRAGMDALSFNIEATSFSSEVLKEVLISAFKRAGNAS